jgi:hypothetical protein
LGGDGFFDELNQNIVKSFDGLRCSWIDIFALTGDDAASEKVSQFYSMVLP